MMKYERANPGQDGYVPEIHTLLLDERMDKAAGVGGRSNNALFLNENGMGSWGRPLSIPESIFERRGSGGVE